ncbi:helix-turn-helix domain-containing protein [Streptomyces sp. TBY4]|uniref:winged helix-turn-helix domain-containing protein n=1 Tax=Streptomyces sp. TBY4 TaxID=2962030 RepID=UPI0020B64912|nr:helix-turn-helix domain-containing protein [Streptomyces sp. TBY4]MCP3759152.1 helix-turn-helix domain-containing protein [Streptomyces sp. TBY4]
MRLLVVEAGVEAPICTDIREDWVRTPLSKDDLRARMNGLRVRGGSDSIPSVDHNGVLRFRRRSAVLSPTETDLVSKFAESFTQPVGREALLAVLARTSRPSRNALDLHVMRIRRRVQPIGLQLRTLWGRGYVLEPADETGT